MSTAASAAHKRSRASPVKTRTSLSSDDIYERVKAMAARFEFKPDERINEIELSRKLNVSRTPLREVLNRLMVEGFLTRTLSKGFIARSLDPQEILELYEFRRGLELSILQLACARATDAELKELEAFTLRSSQLQEDFDEVKLCSLDEEFHIRIAKMARNSEYVRALENVNARIHYIRWLDMRKRRHFTQSEHMEIVRALQARRADDAARLMTEHISRRLDQIVEIVKAGLGEIYMRNREGY